MADLEVVGVFRTQHNKVKEKRMSIELKQIESKVNVFVGKPISWVIYGFAAVTAFGCRKVAGCGRRLRQRWLAYRAAA